MSSDVRQGTDTPTVDASRSFLGSVADLITVKGVVLILYLSVITGVSVVAGRAAHGFLTGGALVLLLVAATVFEYVRYDRLDYVGVASVCIAVAYTVLEYVGTLQNLWFPVAAAVTLLATSGYQAWRDDVADAAEFVEHLDIVGLHGGVLLLLYSLLLAGAPLEFIYAPVFPAVLLFFAVSLLVTTIAYATRSPSVASDELHHRLVSVVRGLDEIDDENREKLGEHVRAVAQALTGVAVPSRVTLDDGPVPVVLPATGPPVYEADDADDLMRRVEGSGLTGYAVDGDDVMLVKNGTPTLYYLSEEDRFGHAELLPDGRFEGANLYADAYVFVDAIESVVPEPGRSVDGEDWAEDAVERVEDVQDSVDTLLTADEKGAEEAVTSPDSDEEEGDEDTEDADGDGPGKIDVGGDEIDLDDMFEKADEMFD
jgi:hypothetical protein